MIHLHQKITKKLYDAVTFIRSGFENNDTFHQYF